MMPSSKFTPKRAAAIVKALERGHSFRHAAGLAGVAHTTAYAWLAKGADATSERDPFARFAMQVERANAKAADYALATIRDAFPTDWRSAMAFLERRFPDEYTKRQRREITGPKDGPVEIVVTWPTGLEPPR